ncbi:MAG: hypothetical protein IT185_04130 [Acidobacteria bacterium]|nr:hypothetical protein [Acidobacteriota bacterium]
MGFTIEIAAPHRENPERDNLGLRDELIRAFPGLTDFPLDHDLIAKDYAHVPREEVLDHWAQFELHANDTLGNAIIDIWLSAVFIELTSTPAESCEARLLRVRPILDNLAQRGFHVPPLADLVVEYEEQRRRVVEVARLI